MVSSIEIMLEIWVCWAKGHEETLGVDTYAHYLEWEDGFMGAHICQNLANCVLYTGAVIVC